MAEFGEQPSDLEVFTQSFYEDLRESEDENWDKESGEFRSDKHKDQQLGNDIGKISSRWDIYNMRSSRKPDSYPSDKLGEVISGAMSVLVDKYGYNFVESGLRGHIKTLGESYKDDRFDRMLTALEARGKSSS